MSTFEDDGVGHQPNSPTVRTRANWWPAALSILAIVVAALLGLTGHSGVAEAVAGVGLASAGVSVTINIRL